MKMDRNIRGNQGRGKYALVLLRKLDGREPNQFAESRREVVTAMIEEGLVDPGIAGTESEFFVIRLKDKYAGVALAAYAAAAAEDDPEWSREVAELAGRAGFHHDDRKRPD